MHDPYMSRIEKGSESLEVCIIHTVKSYIYYKNISKAFLLYYKEFRETGESYFE